MTRRVGVLAIVTGVLTGLVVAAFERVITDELVDRLFRSSLWVQALAPIVGLSVAALVLRWVGRGASPSTADDYIANFHEDNRQLDVTVAPARVLASGATLGGGAAMGLEGPSLYMGAVIGSWLQRTFRSAFRPADDKVLLVCGAAAGVAAIFKAPATGLVFALEVPYRQDLARHRLLPAMFSAAASYVVLASINGTTQLFHVAGAPPFDLRDLGGAALLGLICGACARVFSVGVRNAKRVSVNVSAAVRLPIAAVLLIAVFVLCRGLTGESLVIGPGYHTLAWTLEPDHAAGVVLAVFVLRGLATTLAVAAGGVGGLFIPLVVQGALVGSTTGILIGGRETLLFPLLGVAAFLAAGYRVPLAAVVFVAETTGRAEFVVPALIAAATSQLLMGSDSVSAYQQDTRIGR